MHNQKLIKQINKQLRRNSAMLEDYIQGEEPLELTVSSRARKPFRRLSGMFQFEPALASWLHSASALGGSIWLRAGEERIEVQVRVPGRGKVERCFETGSQTAASA